MTEELPQTTNQIAIRERICEFLDIWYSHTSPQLNKGDYFSARPNLVRLVRINNYVSKHREEFKEEDREFIQKLSSLSLVCEALINSEGVGAPLKKYNRTIIKPRIEAFGTAYL